MKLKDWEVYQKIRQRNLYEEVKENQPVDVDFSVQVQGVREELRKVVKEIEKLPEEDILLATRILMQFLK